MLRTTIAIATAVGLLAFAVVTAQAASGSPHFVTGQTTDSVNTSGQLVVSFKEAGLASGAQETISVTATATADWFCVNSGSHNPGASNKRTSNSAVTASGTFSAQTNGNVTGALTAPAPPTPAGLSCPNGQSLELGSVTYAGVAVADITSGASLGLPNVSTGCLISAKFAKGVSCVG